jgi:hypothetical protein
MAYHTISDDLIKGKVNSVVSEQLPEFIKSDHPTFVAFMEAYYEWLENHGGSIETTRNAKIYNDIDLTVDTFVDYFKRNYLVDLPDSIVNDKRTLLKHIKEFYQAKGTDKALILLFRMLFNEEVSVYYPKRDMLRVSGGQFTSDIIMSLKDVTGPITEMVGKQVVQANQPLQPDINRATALIENFSGFQVGANFIYQLTFTENSTSGIFVNGQTVTIEGDTGTITGVVDSIITGTTVVNDGSYYAGGDALVTKNLTPEIQLEDSSGNIKTESGDALVTEDIGDSAQFDLTTIGRGGVDGYFIQQRGKGYAIGETLAYANTNLGANANAIVSRVEGRLINEASGDGILLETGHNILAGDLDEIIKEDGDNILLETGDKLIPETSDFAGAIHELLIVNEGANYTALPTVTVNTTNGTGAEIYATSTNIGRITGVQRTNLGSGYLRPPLIIPPNNMILKDIVGTFQSGETVTTQNYRVLKEDSSNIILETGDKLLSEETSGQSGQLISIDTSRQLYKVKVDTYRDTFDAPRDRSRITGAISGATATVHQCDVANIVPSVGTVSTSEGVLFGADGRLSESSKKIQDSFYFQDFSYVVKVGNSINVWRDAVKRILHPVGLALFGEVSIATSVSARAWGGSEVRLNGTAPRFKQLQLLILQTMQSIAVPRMQKLELEIFSELVYSGLFPTTIELESGGRILMENSSDANSNEGANYLRAEDSFLEDSEGAVYPTLTFPTFPTPIANINATMQVLKDITLFLRETQVAFDESAVIPNSPNNPTLGGNQHGKTKQTPDPMIIIQTFEAYMNDLTMSTTVKRELQIMKELAMVARSVQDVVHLLLPTITSTDKLTAVSTSKLHLIASLGLEDAHLHESYGSAKLGSTGYSLDRFKFLFPPYSAGTRQIDRGGRIYRGTYNSAKLTQNYSGTNTSNDTYWDTYANTQIKHLNEIINSVDDLVNYPGRKQPLVFDSEIFLRSS